MDYKHICIAAMVTLHDLKTAHKALCAGTEDHSTRQLFFRHLISELANTADLANVSGAMYRDHPELGELHTPIKKALEFYKYLRNQYAGHFVPELSAKTLEWMPLAAQLSGKADTESQLFVSLAALETAINTFTENTGHKVFESETDLMYPPDQQRFLNHLGDTVSNSIKYLEALATISRSKFEVPEDDAEVMELYKKAGQTEFSVLKRGKKR